MASCAFLLGPLASSSAQTLAPHQQIALDIYKEVVEINTVTTTGDTTGDTERAAEAMAARLRAAGHGCAKLCRVTGGSDDLSGVSPECFAAEQLVFVQIREYPNGVIRCAYEQ